MRQLTFPATDQIDEVTILLELELDQAAILWQRVRSIVAETERHAAHVAKTPDRGARLSSIRTVVAACSKLAGLFDSDGQRLPQGLLSTVLNEIGHLLSLSAVEEIAKGSVAWGISDRGADDVLLHERGCRAPDVAAQILELEQLTDSRRRDVAVQIGPKLIGELISRIQGPFEAQLRIEKAHRGGRPQDLYRNYLIQELVPVFETIYGRAATGTISKSEPTFITFCNAVTHAVGIELAGVDRAVERLFKKLRRERQLRQS